MTPQEQDFLTAGPRWSDLPRQSEGPADCRERCQLSGVQVGRCSALQDMAPLSPKGKTGICVGTSGSQPGWTKVPKYGHTRGGPRRDLWGSGLLDGVVAPETEDGGSSGFAEGCSMGGEGDGLGEDLNSRGLGELQKW